MIFNLAAFILISVFFRENISLYAHETQSKYSSLDYFDQSLLLDQFYHEFVKGKLAAETMLKDKKIEIRFAFFENKVVSVRRESEFLFFCNP